MPDDLFQAIGGASGCHKVSAAFYARVDRDPVLSPLFPGKTHTCAIEAFAAFLVQFLGGPVEDTQRRWFVSLRESHMRFPIGPKERDAWMKTMIRALDEVQIAEPARTALREFFAQSSAYLVNRGSVQAEPAGCPEIARRWEAQTSLDEAVAAVHKRDTARAIALADGLAPRVGLVGLLALMIGSGDEALRGYVRQALRRDASLVQARRGGRTLLHEAAGAGDLATVELLLELGADPNESTAGGHSPLYCVGNECKAPGGPDVVRTLVKAGANVNSSGGVKRCTPLHMAARRGSAEIARALLESGAALDARDASGDTPLRRALNCRKAAVASLLRAAGAGA